MTRYKIFMFTYVDQASAIASIRVAAKNKQDACALVDPSYRADQPHPAPSVLCEFCGYVELAEASVMAIKFRPQREEAVA